LQKRVSTDVKSVGDGGSSEISYHLMRYYILVL